MTRPTTAAEKFLKSRFGELPRDRLVRIFGTLYARLDLEEGGELYVTHEGWCRLPALLPAHWFLDKRYAREGSRLAGGSGNVFQVDCPAPTKPNMKLVVKFARSGQEVPLHVTGTFPPNISESEIRGARWNSPFEEFGLLTDLRRGRFGPPDLRIKTKRPLAIYCPPRVYQTWQLGRSPDVWKQMNAALEHAQEIAEGKPVHLYSSRIYILLFEWISGESAEDYWKEGLLTKKEMRSLSERVARELEMKGYKVLDNKPKHFILRKSRDGRPLRRGGEIVYALVDFELLKRTPEYEDWLQNRSV